MISVMLDCRSQEHELAISLASLVPGAVEGLIREVIVCDRGSRDGTRRVADAAGCLILDDPEMQDLLTRAKGEWLLLLEPGARLTSGWITEISDYVQSSDQPAHFALSRLHRGGLLMRLMRRHSNLELGLLIPRRLLLLKANPNGQLGELASGIKTQRLSSELVPASETRKRLQRNAA